MLFSFLSPKSPHYHGDFVRILFLISGVILIIGVPYYPEIFPFNTTVTIAYILMLGLLAGLTNPRQFWTANTNSILSSFSFLIFEYYAIEGSKMFTALDTPFMIKQLLALIFFFAMYYSVKTSRAEYLKRKLPAGGAGS